MKKEMPGKAVRKIKVELEECKEEQDLTTCYERNKVSTYVLRTFDAYSRYRNHDRYKIIPKEPH